MSALRSGSSTHRNRVCSGFATGPLHPVTPRGFGPGSVDLHPTDLAPLSFGSDEEERVGSRKRRVEVARRGRARHGAGLASARRDQNQLRQARGNAARGHDPAARRARTCPGPRPRSGSPRCRRAAGPRRRWCPADGAPSRKRIDRPSGEMSVTIVDPSHEKSRWRSVSPRFRRRSVSSELATNRQPVLGDVLQEEEVRKGMDHAEPPVAIDAPEGGRVDVRAARGVPDLAGARVPPQPDAALEDGSQSPRPRVPSTETIRTSPASSERDG